MFGIRKFLKRHFSVEAMTTAVERKIASDLAANPAHPRNAIGGQLIASIQSVREQAIARRELETLLPEYHSRAMALLADTDRFNSQTPEWRGAHPDIRAALETEDLALKATAKRITTLAEIAGIDLTSVTISNG